ncbi:Aldehyde dehydrogenase family 3 member F1 [Thelohanellus kitauei]|uniref:Aldehyde dehydrogenase family 3 member F1 n=1 Tax=Thelohanellus kitauei TaxID=669202 RepID=A0A0C2ND40_THEKT|nr:Aldehyde dehydrogenase family 3 member F1 [Thelohanellus kitauei]
MPIPSDTISLTTPLKTIPVPHGSVLIVSTWNYPILHAFEPLLNAIAAGIQNAHSGNTVVLKIPDSLPHLASFIKNMIDNNLDKVNLRRYTGMLRSYNRSG